MTEKTPKIASNPAANQTGQAPKDGEKRVWLTNLITAPIHIASKNADGEIENVCIAPLKALAVGSETMKMRGVMQFIDEGKLKVVSQAEAAKLNKEHDLVVKEGIEEDADKDSD